MTRRNTYVCSDRNNTERLSVIPNGKENRWERMFVVFDLVSSLNSASAQDLQSTQRAPVCNEITEPVHFCGTCCGSQYVCLFCFTSSQCFLCQYCGLNAVLELFLPNKNAKLLIMNKNVVKFKARKYGYTKISSSASQTRTAVFHHLLKENPDRILFVSSLYFLSLIPSFLYLLPLFLIILFFHFCLCVCGSGGCCFFIVAWPAWLRWLVPLALPLALRPLRSVPRPVRCGWGIKPSALCTFARQAGPRCPTPTTLWTTAPPSKTAGPPTTPLSVSSHVSAPVWPLANPHIQPASHSVTPRLNHGHHFLQGTERKATCFWLSVSESYAHRPQAGKRHDFLKGKIVLSCSDKLWSESVLHLFPVC